MPDDAGRPGYGPWFSFVTASTAAEFCAGWLAVVCEKIPATVAGVLVLRQDDDTFVPAALWPESGLDPAYLAPVVERTLKACRGVSVRTEATLPARGSPPALRGQVGYPVEHNGRLEGAVVLDLREPTDRDMEDVLRDLHWASAWLHGLLRGREGDSDRCRLEQAKTALETVAVAHEHRKLHATAMAVTNELALRLGCDRVSIGLLRRDRMRIVAMSHTAWFQRMNKLVGTIENAMEEAVDQHASVTLPAIPATGRRVTAAHADLARATSASGVASVVMTSRGRPIGAITLERRQGEPFDVEAVELGETIASLVGPVLELKSDARRWFAGRLVEGAADGIRAVLGPRRPSIKLAAIAVLGLLAVLAIARGEHRVSARAVVEGEQLRAAVVPFEGYVTEAHVRAGDTVREGDLLASLDDQDLQLEAAKVRATRAQLEQKYREAAAKHDRASARILAAQIRETEAELRLVEQRLARTRIVAPFDGLIVTGDLSQKLGTPVTKGEVLFEITPLEAYRVILHVDERDISRVGESQEGRLVLAGLTGEALPFTVNTVTPVSIQEEGTNVFRVEAALGATGVRLRPGMEGVGKIVVGEARLLWIWTHPLWDWLRLTVWKWTP